MENAVAVLEILRSPAMEQARKTLLNNAVNRILNQQGQATVVAAEVPPIFLPRDNNNGKTGPRKYHGPRVPHMLLLAIFVC